MTTTHAVQFNASLRDRGLIRRIARRAVAQGFAGVNQGWPATRELQDVEMDIEAVHCNGTPLRLAEMIEADDFNFGHDVVGIGRHLDRTTGTLGNHFLPRFAKPQGAR